MQTSVIKKTLLATVMLLCLGLAAPSAQAVVIKGVPSCGKWVNDSKVDDGKVDGWPKIMNKAWFLGFISGLATESDRDVLRGTDVQSLYLWVDNFCQSNPLKAIDDAADMLFLELAKQKRL